MAKQKEAAMTAPKWTPGPWTIPPASMGFSQITGGDGELVFGLAAGLMTERRTEDVCEANASLIASAPELYEALEAMLDIPEAGYHGGFGGPDTPCAFCDAVKMASAALAKARGETS